ncbi:MULTISPECIES: peptidoglycan DD-metalloendopeptidase family protein [unclassified Nodularia (in: cyanobacteria)]|uniref:peptidoglycan DD-metalloendopeptidase family protein n=1 Tax=unclassified Nodularia (in: cyanobacteria) TaxID=2656917 RepID=UPI00187FA0B2|nr:MULTISPECIES: peptidoglycan DD-metalloendopeptidase family protein [unclassified Nodularia (in: cyanobacteria)]MBE9197858.1 peptidoglycan DD-metalloendopeptidase family protein [Nodularia sp. LEGE 06071]MCC2694616.1 peptidoglycan DD-metalloendopeptidase family protein [Nodularia sp. LEGE 04288]
MTQRHKSAHHHLNNSSRRSPYGKLFHIYASTLPAQSFFLLSSASFLSGGLAIAQTETGIDNIVPTVESSQSAVVIPNPVKKDTLSSALSRPQPEVAEPQADLRQRLRSTQEVSPPKANVTLEKPKTEVSTPRANVSLEKPKTEVSTPRANVSLEKLKTEVSPPRANVSLEKPKTEVSTPRANVTLEKLKTEVAQPSTPRTLPEKLPEIAQPSNNSNGATIGTTGKTRDYNNAYIDPINYNPNATATYQAPNSVVLTERSSGCQTVLPSGQSLSGSSCAQATQKPESNQQVANSEAKTAPNWLKTSQNTQVANVPVARPAATNNSNNRWTPNQAVSGGATKTASRPNRFIPNPSDFATTSANRSAIAPSGGTLPPPMAAGNIAPRPSTVAYDFQLASVLPQIPFTGRLAYSGDGGMAFPLSIPARISSVFGWRTHPITGDSRFHAGTDLAAPTGTPVVAAAEGTVQTANWMGGYGLTVVVNHPSAQQTLYAHMSELFVQPGQRVEQGTVIGRVGSTGNSTGPHLHFEVRHLKPQGWVAVDSGVQLQVALSQMLQALQTAQVTQDPDS